MKNSKFSTKQKKDKTKNKGLKNHEEKDTNGDSNEKPFDFGGITSRDLKKNLGCG